MSYEEPNRHQYGEWKSPKTATPALAQPTPPVEQKVEKQAEVTQQAAGSPQSGSPISDAVLDGIKKMTGKGEDKATAQVTESSNEKQYMSVHDKLEEKVFQNAVDYQKFADKQSESFSKNLDKETLSVQYLKDIEDKKLAEIKKTEDVKQKKEDEKLKKEQDIKKAEEEKWKKEHPKEVKKMQEPGASTTSEVVNKILNEDVKENEQEVQKAVSRIHTDEEDLNKAWKES